jgi:hypothetical protein
MKTGMFKYSLLAATMAFSGLTMAANPSATLLVKGQVSTGTCTAVLDTPDINLGTTSTDKLPATGSYTVKSSVKTLLNVDCTSPLKYQISLTDNRSDSAEDATVLGLDSSFSGGLMGLGTTTDGIKIGGYQVAFSSVTSAVNGSTVISPSRLLKSIESMTSAADWTVKPNNSGVFYVMAPLNNTAGNVTRTSYIAVAKSGESEPCATTAATFQFMSNFYLSRELQSITDQEQIDGSVTFNLDYL